MADEQTSRLFFFDGLFGYIELKHWALLKIRTCPMGSALFDIRMIHNLYFQNLLSAYDHVADFLSEDENALARFKMLAAGDNSYFEYVRELRNAIVHRGIDATASGTVEGSYVRALCPPSIPNKAETRSFPAPCHLLLELAERCERYCNPAFLSALEELGLLEDASHRLSVEHYQEAIRSAPHMPDAVKQSALAWFGAPRNFEAISSVSGSRTQQIRNFLS